MTRFKPVIVPDAAAYTFKKYNSGLMHVIPDLTADSVFTLPTAEAGLEYRIMYGGAAADAQDWLIDTGADANYFIGGLLYFDTDAGAAADEVFPVMADGNSNSKLTVLTPQGGTWLYLICDGTHWYINGAVATASASSAAFADQA
jgi:hypothetical protein